MEQKLYLYSSKTVEVMNLEARKYNFIQDFFSIEKESIIAKLESILKQEREAHQEISVAHKQILDERSESYRKNPNDVLDWEDVKNDW